MFFFVIFCFLLMYETIEAAKLKYLSDRIKLLRVYKRDTIVDMFCMYIVYLADNHWFLLILVFGPS